MIGVYGAWSCADTLLCSKDTLLFHIRESKQYGIPAHETVIFGSILKIAQDTGDHSLVLLETAVGTQQVRIVLPAGTTISHNLLARFPNSGPAECWNTLVGPCVTRTPCLRKLSSLAGKSGAIYAHCIVLNVQIGKISSSRVEICDGTMRLWCTSHVHVERGHDYIFSITILAGSSFIHDACDPLF